MYTTIAINYPSKVSKVLFYGGILAMVFLFDVVKMRFSYYLKQHLTATTLQQLKKLLEFA